ncbi:hypothetical protein N7490_006640 [Penicillium lividum]|nr:hypothetical protein N7490_006497 [Penicillium lividum]KAJ5642640.1 hypothetical protein N7490_006640 [Penicillium lividum]
MSVGEQNGKHLPPGYRHDWKSAKSFWDSKSRRSLLEKFRDAYHHMTLNFKSHRNPAGDGVVAAVKAFRRDARKDVFSPQERDVKARIAYGRYAIAMNEIERRTDYRFPIPATTVMSNVSI